MENLNPSAIETWPAAVVAVTLILAVLVVPSVLTVFGNKRIKRVETSITTNNGGNSVKDRFDRLEVMLHEHMDWSAAYVKDTEERLSAVEKRRGLRRLF